VINAVWISISDRVEFFLNPVRSGFGSELQNPVVSRSGNRIMFNTVLCGLLHSRVATCQIVFFDAKFHKFDLF